MSKAQNYIWTIFIVLIVNAVILFLLAKIWIDPLELTLNSSVQFNEIAKIIEFSISSLIGSLILYQILRKKQVYSLKRRLFYSVVLTLLICSYLYVDYSIRIVNNRIVNCGVRDELLIKARPLRMGAYSNYVLNDLNISEYRQIARILEFPKLNRQASNISVNYGIYQNLFGDCSLRIEYDLPKNVDIKEFEYHGDRMNYKNYQRVEQVGSSQKVTFVEDSW